MWRQWWQKQRQQQDPRLPAQLLQPVLEARWPARATRQRGLRQLPPSSLVGRLLTLGRSNRAAARSAQDGHDSALQAYRHHKLWCYKQGLRPA
mmetsp:Transcript_31880/g.83947  ORF Transcript_31880/g.83947 Transcript_31880/m.83947 type:complete len:93 (+) Transcript_31880:282-560(+)